MQTMMTSPKWFWPVLLTAVLALAPPLAHARDDDDDRASELQARAPASTMHGELRLALADAIAMGVENNLNVEVARHDPLIAFEDSRIAWGAYDPQASAQTSLSDFDSPTANPFESGASTTLNYRRSWSGESSIAGLIPWANTEYSVKLTGERLATNSSLSNLQPEFSSNFTLALTQPVMKNLVWNESWTQVKVSRIQYESALEEFRRALMDVVRDIENAYWGLVATDEQERVALKSLEQANALLEQTKVQYEVGVVSKVEVVEAEAGVAEREVDLIRATNAYRSAQDVLIDRVLGTQLTPESRLEINPTDRPDDYRRFAIDQDQAARKAFDNRPELSISRRAIHQQRINLKFAKNQRLPELDITGSIGYEGLAGSLHSGRLNRMPTRAMPVAAPTVNQPAQRTWGDSFDNYFEEQGALQWSIGGMVSIPIGNVAGRHGVTKAEIALRRSRTELVRLEQSIVLEIRQTVRDLKSAQEGIEAAERRRLAAEEQFRAESIRLEQGESTPFDVLLRERDLVDAESQKINAFQVYRDSVTALERAQGTILSANNIAVDRARALR